MQAAEQVSKDQPRATFRGITFKRPVGSLTLESGNLADSQSGSLLVVNKTEAKLPQSGKLLRRFKLRNLGSNEIFEVALDETGKEVDAERLLQHEFAAIGQQRGKLSEDLIHRMNSNLGKGGIPVALRLRGDDVVSTRQPVSAESAKRIAKDERRRLANEAQLRNHAAQRARYVRSQEAVLSMARVRDPRAHGTPEMGAVYANLIESEIRELAAMPEVEEIGGF